MIITDDIEEKIIYIIFKLSTRDFPKQDTVARLYIIDTNYEICDNQTGLIRFIFNDTRTDSKNDFLLLRININEPEGIYIDMVEGFFKTIEMCKEYNITNLSASVNIKPAKK